MQKSEDGCIRYLMKEMDPSEEVEFEREMMRDDNLLIEVESLRKTFQKLGKLPVQEPPEELTKHISELAVSTQQERLRQSKKWMFLLTRSVAAAAVILMVVSTGIYLSGPDDTVATGENSPASPATISPDKVDPWVDRNNIIEFAGTSVQANYTPALQTDVDQSFTKLKLVNDQTGFTAPTRKILLTSTSR